MASTEETLEWGKAGRQVEEMILKHKEKQVSNRYKEITINKQYN